MKRAVRTQFSPGWQQQLSEVTFNYPIPKMSRGKFYLGVLYMACNASLSTRLLLQIFSCIPWDQKYQEVAKAFR